VRTRGPQPGIAIAQQLTSRADDRDAVQPEANMTDFSRRTFLRAGLAGTTGLYLGSRFGGTWTAVAAIPGGTLRPAAVPKFVEPLLVPPAMPAFSTEGSVDAYRIAVGQFRQQVLPRRFRPTTVWGYGPIDYPGAFNAPSLTIEAQVGRAVRVQWTNALVDAQGRYLPHLLPVDQTLHWANPPGGMMHRDHRGYDPSPYTGPVPIVVHLHGGHTDEESDGYTESWYLPAASNIPAGYATEGTFYAPFKEKFAQAHGLAWAPGTATFQYGNDQAAGTLWFHDHALGMTRLNVYAGPAGFYLLRGGDADLPAGVLPGPAPSPGDAPGAQYYEIPLAIQDRSFNANASLYYPDTRAFFEGVQPGQLKIPFAPDPACGGPSDVAPIWNPEFFGNMMMVNGRTWPYLDVEARRYRFRVLNGCNSRFLILKLSRPGLRFWQVGGDLGFLTHPVEVEQLLLAPAERADVIVDFTNVPTGTTIVLENVAPDEPFGGGIPGVDFVPADANSTGVVMQFRVVAATSADTSTPPALLALPLRAPLPHTSITRDVSLNEEESRTVHVVSRGNGPVVRFACDDPAAVPFGPVAALLGTLDGDHQPEPLAWMDAITEMPTVGTTETWHIHNRTMDAHPIHLHLVGFEVVRRVGMDGVERGPEAGETGLKDTVIAYPAEVTTVKAHFDKAGLYVWHCHILEHEDNEMMRPMKVVPAT
jgi:spore coat protein A, manganese oxidase